MSNQSISLSEDQFKGVARRLRENLESILGCQASHAQSLQLLAQSLFSKPYEEIKATLLTNEEERSKESDNELSEVEEKYIRLGRQACPFCESDNISGNEVNVDADAASQEVGCDECGASWRDVYLFGFAEGFEEG